MHSTENRLVRRTVLALASISLAVVSSIRAAPAPKQPGPNAANIGVLLLPATDTEPWAANVLGQRQLVVRRRLQHDFLARGFKVYNEALAQVAADVSPKIDLTDPLSRSAKTLDALAARSGARWIVSVDVQQVADEPGKADDGRFHCFCRVSLKLWDAADRTWRADGVFTGHDQGGHNSPVWLFMESIDEATRVALASVVDEYPVVVDMGAVGPIVDYLAAETRPFVPKIGQPLGGLSLPQ